jgi:tagaturonate reductase
VVQPLAGGMVSKLNDQDGKYHLFLRGVEKGQKVDSMEVIESISRGIDPYKDFDAYMALAENPDMRFIVSNTTEAGIEYIGTEKQDDRPAKSFPAKVTQLLAKRFELGLPGFIFLPCELIDDNAVYLKKYILQYADLWELGDDFKTWIEEENVFCNTLVDRITTGYPRDQLVEFEARVTFPDQLIDTAEAFYLWVIEGDHEDELPLQKAGLNVVWTPDVKPYKKRKVRILNGGHTSMVTGALLYGMETVGQCMEDSLVRPYLDHVLFEEVVPTLGQQPGRYPVCQGCGRAFCEPLCPPSSGLHCPQYRVQV